MTKGKRGRHAPAFILLAIATAPTHGLGVLNIINEQVPNNRLDTAIIYRTLKEFEAKGYITSDWTDSEAGPKKKIYTITDSGLERLKEFRGDIEKSLNNLQQFIRLHNDI